ncbi:MAG TPA: replication factor C small subunit [Candidatus Nanoarchaeia archaeon]|nr:replication factor C small subunit [Candidatus Nanoarchaeia archaeon]
MAGSSIWTEKFRPKSFDEVAGQRDTVKKLKALVESKNLPHMLFSGPPGIGKTTLALIVSKQLHGNNWKQNFLELNASDSRGIDTIRTQVKDFAKTMALESESPKIILLDEADALTKEAQQALRRTMETYANSCRFILSCNFVNKIIDPIKSRCAIFKFKPLTKEDSLEIIKKIARSEELKIDENAVNKLYELTNGDIRQLQNVLQSCSSISKTITENEINEFAAKIESNDIKEILNLAFSKKFLLSRNKMLDTILNNGLSGIDIIKQIQREVMEFNMPEEKKLNIIEKCGEIEFRLVEGSNEYIQLESLLAFIAKN